MIASTPQQSAPRTYVVLGLIVLIATLASPSAGAQVTGLSAAVGEAPSTILADARSAGFLERQLRHPRVRRAFDRHSGAVEEVLRSGGIRELGDVFFRVLKRERILELWAREAGATTFSLLKTYPVCAVSGDLGPKQRQGDLQVPEGFYSIDLFNPSSQYHLSMRVDYPNRLDRRRSGDASPGGDIYIHGGCATVGCVPVTDHYIEELYLVAAAARDAGQRRIPVHIFPTRLDEEGMDWLTRTFGQRHDHLAFWRNLGEGYRAFEKTRVVPRVAYQNDRYSFLRPAPRGPLGTPAAATPAEAVLGIPAAPLLLPSLSPTLDAPAGRLAPAPRRAAPPGL